MDDGIKSVARHGVIDASVLTAFGEILTFAGALFGIDAKYKQKIIADA